MTLFERQKCAITQHNTHMDSYNMHEPNQSAYRSGYSTQTALVRITNDVLFDLDQRRGVILVLLDLSAAFDTTAHAILTNQLEF